MLNMANVHKRITIKAAVLHFGRAPDGYGGKAALARALGVTQAAINRWQGPCLPDWHAATLLKAPHKLAHLARGSRACT
jgi:hypothetical protein